MFTEKELAIMTFVSAAAAGAGWRYYAEPWGPYLLYGGLVFLALALGKGIEQYLDAREDRIVRRLSRGNENSGER